MSVPLKYPNTCCAVFTTHSGRLFTYLHNWLTAKLISGLVLIRTTTTTHPPPFELVVCFRLLAVLPLEVQNPPLSSEPVLLFYLMSIQQIPSVGLLSHLQLLMIPLAAPLELEPTESDPSFVTNFFQSLASPFFLQPLHEAVLGVGFSKNHKIVHIDHHHTHLPISVRTYFFSWSVTTFTQDSPQISLRCLF